MPAADGERWVGDRLASASLANIGEKLARVDVPCELVAPGYEPVQIGPRRFWWPRRDLRITLKNDHLLRVPLTELSVGEAYVNGDVDLDGDITPLFELRDILPFGMPLGQRARLAAELLLPPVLANARAIDAHYSFGDDFYLTFLDPEYRFYSQCLFPTGHESLKRAAKHKLKSMWDALGLRRGMRLLDIGGGWGGVAQYCGSRGVHVTSLTLSQDSANYMKALIKERRLTAEVIVEDILQHVPNEPYDHVVIFGVIEHIPNYRRFCQRVWAALKPGGRLYLDASATKEKYAAGAFTRQYTWSGPHSCLALQLMVQELLFHGFEVVRVRRETRDYELTMRHWADRFEANEDDVVKRWNEQLYRAFRVFLRGGSHAFKTNRLQAYSVVAERRLDPGPRPGVVRRFGQFAGSLR
jgi:cyclopropane fatty-acyl-phospholipid synthase-like methyltransferase